MITFTILLLMVVAITIGVVALATVGGTAFLVVFGDVIVAGIIIAMIWRLISSRKKG